MRLIINSNPGAWVATYIKEKIKQHQPSDNNKFILGLPTGSTSIALYEYLIKYYKNNALDFKNIITFNMDEYIGLPKNHPQSYWTFMQKHLFNQVNIATENIHIPNGMAENIKQECSAYEDKIKSCNGINLFIGGVGKNGHIAFNEPYSSLSSVTRDKELSRQTIQDNSHFFADDIDAVPKSAITVGTKTLLKAEEVMIMVTGEDKALALAQGMEGAVSHTIPLSVLQMHKKAVIVADEWAVSELKVRTYRHFKTLNDEYSNIEKLIIT